MLCLVVEPRKLSVCLSAACDLSHWFDLVWSVGPNTGAGSLTLNVGSGGSKSITLGLGLSWTGDVTVSGDGASTVTLTNPAITSATGRLLTGATPIVTNGFALQGSIVSSASTSITLTSATLAAATQFQVAPSAGTVTVTGGVALAGAGADFSFGESLQHVSTFAFAVFFLCSSLTSGVYVFVVVCRRCCGYQRCVACGLHRLSG